MKIENLLSQIKFGDLQVFENITIVPLFLEMGNIPNFISLTSALGTGKFLVQEVSYHGEVSTLKVINNLEEKVFILDGEELKGGKQNRVINASILVGENSILNIPVSCTERGRWSYISSYHSEPEVVIPSLMRSKKNVFVYEHLKNMGKYVSDQNLIWEEVERYSQKYRIKSRTYALRDIYENLKETLYKNMAKFPLLDKQKGLIAFINGEIKGLDLISLSSVYKDLHEKLIKSYIIDSIIEKESFNKNHQENIEKFFDEIKSCEILKFKSIGLGWDYRLKGKNIMGSVLIYEDAPIHMYFSQIK